MIGAPLLPEAGGCRVASVKVWPPWNRTVSPGCNDARFTRETVCQGAEAEPEFASEPDALT